MTWACHVGLTLERFPCSTTMGVDHEVSSARATRQRCLPVRLSRATRNDCSSWSQLTTSVSPCKAGELPSPCPCLVCISPRFFFQSSLPRVSRQYSPYEPKDAKT